MITSCDIFSLCTILFHEIYSFGTDFNFFHKTCDKLGFMKDLLIDNLRTLSVYFLFYTRSTLAPVPPLPCHTQCLLAFFVTKANYDRHDER